MGDILLVLGLLPDSLPKTFFVTMPSYSFPTVMELDKTGTPVSTAVLALLSGVKAPSNIAKVLRTKCFMRERRPRDQGWDRTNSDVR